MAEDESKKGLEVVEIKRHEVPELDKIEELSKPVHLPQIKRVSPEVRHARAVLRRISSSLGIKERKTRQKKSKQELKKATIKPSSGHESPRPNRHANKRGKIERYTSAK